MSSNQCRNRFDDAHLEHDADYLCIFVGVLVLCLEGETPQNPFFFFKIPLTLLF
jgi:hypothetical protein